MIVNEILAVELPGFLDAVLDYSGDDSGFVELLRTWTAEIIVKVLGEIEEGFIDGINDILVFFKVNATKILMAATLP